MILKKTNFCILSFTICLELLIFGCNKKQEIAPGPPYSAHVLQINPLNKTDARSISPTYTFSKATYSTLTNMDTLDGTYFQIVRGGLLQLESITGSIAIQKGFSGGRSPGLRYILQDNSAVPKDYNTLAMLSAYYQFDLIAQNIQTMTGISIDSIISSYGKIKILFEPKISLESNTTVIEASQKFNAAYMPTFHQFVLFQRSSLENVPLSVNLQVISHEFGHAIWEYSFDNGKTPNCDRISEEYAIRGLNEGFADTMSYTLTGSTNVLENSISINNLPRKRNFSTITFTYDQVASIADTKNDICDQSFYCIGTLFANALFNAQSNLGYDQTSLNGTNARGAFTTLITAALKNTKKNMINLPPNPFSDLCDVDIKSTSITYNGQILGSFFQSFLTQISSSTIQTEICKQLVNNFGSVGFPVSYRTGCQ